MQEKSLIKISAFDKDFKLSLSKSQLIFLEFFVDVIKSSINFLSTLNDCGCGLIIISYSVFLKSSKIDFPNLFNKLKHPQLGAIRIVNLSFFVFVLILSSLFLL